MVPPIDLKVELELDSVWTDISTYVYDRDQVRIRHGISSEGTTPEPSKCQLTLDNRDGRFCPRNPTGAYYGSIGRNTPLRVSVPFGESYMFLDQNNSQTATTPDAAVLDITGDIDIRLDLTPHSWRMNQALAAKYDLTGDNRSWAFYINDDGDLNLIWSPDGTLAARIFSEATEPVPFTSGRHAVRVTLDVNNGAGGHTATFYTADTIAGPFTQLGDPVITAGVTSIFSGNAELEVGSAVDITAGAYFGKYHKFELYSGIAGTLVANPDFRIQPAGTVFFNDTTAAPRAWTAFGEIDDRDYRFNGEVSAWPQKWDISGRDVYVPVEAAGVLRRLGQGQSPLNSTMYRGILGDSSTPPVAYWPCEDASDSTRIASAIEGGFPMVIDFGQPSYAAFTSFKCSKPIPTFTDSQWTGKVGAFTGTTTQQVRFLLYMETGNNEERIFTAYTSGTGVTATGIKKVALFYSTGGSLDLRVYDDEDTLITSSGAIAFAIDGKLLRMSIQLTQSGADTIFTMVSLEVGQTSGSFDDTTAAGRSFGRITGVGTNAGGNVTDTTAAIGHISVHNEITSIFDLAQELNAYSGETAVARLIRLSGENDVHFNWIGIADESEAMGPQLPKNLTDLLNECAESDLGVFFEPRDEFGLRYRTRTNLYNLDPIIALTYHADHELAEPLDPVDDDSYTRNDITMSRVDGSSARAVLETGTLSVLSPPNGVGRYDDAPPVNLEDDTRLADQAGWRLLLGTVDEARYPNIAMNLRHPTLDDGTMHINALAVDMGERITVDDPPTGYPPDDISLLAIGYSELLSGFVHTVNVNCKPEAPYRIGVLDNDTLGRADTEGSVLREALTTTETDVDVTITSGPPWVVDPAEFPFDILVGGEVMAVTAIAESDGKFELNANWTGTSCTIVQSATQRHTGGFSGLMTVTGAPAQAFFRPNTHAFVTVGSSYTVEYWSYSVAGYADVNIAIDWLTSAGAYISTSAGAGAATPAGLWKHRTLTAVAPATAALADFGPTVGTSPPAGTAIFFDDIRLTPWEGQTFTVTRSVNGVVKSHSAGAEVKLLQPMIVSL